MGSIGSPGASIEPVTGLLLMNLRRVVLACLWGSLVLGILAFPAAVFIGLEDGPTPADQLWHRKSVAKAVLLVGAAVAALAACGLYAVAHSLEGR
jgi:hypothetical protein